MENAWNKTKPKWTVMQFQKGSVKMWDGGYITAKALWDHCDTKKEKMRQSLKNKIQIFS